MRIINIETKANHIIENFYNSLNTANQSIEGMLELYISDESENDPNFWDWLLEPMTIEESDHVENLTIDEIEEYLQEFTNFTKNYINQ